MQHIALGEAPLILGSCVEARLKAVEQDVSNGGGQIDVLGSNLLPNPTLERDEA